MMTMKMYPCQTSHTYLILLVFAALTVSGYAQYNGDLTLDYYGLVKVYNNGKWGTICKTSYVTSVEGKVICRSLGLKYSYHGSRSSSLPTYIRTLTCRGDEKSPLACPDAYVSSYSYCYYSKLYVRCLENPTEIYCSFDNNMCGMTTEGTELYTWKRTYSVDSARTSRPKVDHTTKSGKGKYMLASAIGVPGQSTSLKLHYFNANMSLKGSISFYYHMFGKDMGNLNIYIKTNSSKIKIHSISGNQGNEWKYACVPGKLNYGDHEFIFEAVHGKDIESNIAIDDVTISTNDCLNWNGDCNFNEGTCNYDIENHYNIRRGWRLQKISGLNDLSYNGEYLTFNSYYSQGFKNSLISPSIIISSLQSKVEFKYYMPATGNELQVRFAEEGHTTRFTNTSYFWQDSGDHGPKWQYGCMELPSKRGNIIFTGISGMSRRLRSVIALDNIDVGEGYCQTGITYHTCTFDNPLLCKYIINCMDLNKFTWRRNYGKTSSYGTGPTSDYSRSTYGYYMYAEASYGKPNDTTQLTFPVSNVKGKYLKFAYNMYGSGVGQLYVTVNTNKSDEKMIWIMEGNKGLYWHKVCLYIDYDISDVTIVAQRGSSYQGDIAIDSISLEKKPCDGPFHCDFEDGMCKYKVYNNSLRYKLYSQSSYSNTNRYLYIYSTTNTENAKFQMMSPQASVKGNSSVSFKYMMRGNVKELALFTNSTDRLWSSNYNDITEFTSVCVDFPFSQDLALLFQVTADVNSYYDLYVSLDDISVSNETCKLGLTYHFCKFKEIHLCNYQVECLENTKFNWSQGSFLNYNFRRPDNFSYTDDKYFMIADSSSGRPGDETRLQFLEVAPPAGHYLTFSYYLQKDAGKLQLHLENLNGKVQMFEEVGSTEVTWFSACVNISSSKNNNIEFTATRGLEFAKIIAVRNVGFKQGYCQARSISCDFSADMICHYGSVGYKKWERIYASNTNDSTNGYYMQVILQYYESKLVSPSENIANSCVQISYKIIGKNCKLTIYNAFNNKTIMSTVSDDTTPWQIAQVHIQNETTKLVFLAKDYRSRYSFSCKFLLDNVKVTENNCPVLVCPTGTRKCKNDYCYEKSKLCDGTTDCSDGSDEANCPTSIACDFKTKFLCGYKVLSGWEYISKTNDSGSMQVTATTNGRMVSPYAELPYSCVKFKFITKDAVTGNLSIILYQLNNTGGLTWSKKWVHTFLNEKDGSHAGQLQFPKGKGFFEFRVNIMSGILAIDDVIVSNGTCPELNCPKDRQKCSDNTKCINKKNICNNYKNCKDGSDEKNCSKFFNCDFEDTNMCGFKSYPVSSWISNSGFFGNRPKLDNSEGTYEGQYIKSNSSSGESRLELPTITIENTFCLNFYYTFFGDGSVSVYDNGTFLMSLSKFDVDMWRNANITVSGGTHNISYMYSNNNASGLVALDSVSIISGNCSHTDCEEGWYSCNSSRTCYAYTSKCDGIKNCPNGEDEYDCTSKKRNEYRLVDGRSLLSGSVNKLYGGEYLPVCVYSSYYRSAGHICSGFGANGTVTKRTKWTYVTGHYLQCSYNIDTSCYRQLCYEKCYCYSLYVTCSNTICEDGEVVCPPSRNSTGTNSTGTNSTDVCIRQESLCDGEIDCEGNTDEEDCEQCTNEQFQCRNKNCIKKDLRCNGVEDCDDGSDEHNCFKYKDDRTVQVLYKSSYQYICEDNLRNANVAKQLCSSVGRSNGTFGNSVEGNGVLFTASVSDTDNQLIPGFEASSYGKCNVTMLKCSEQQCGIRKANLVEPNIQHGHDAVEGEWPWAVQIYRGSTFICTGMLIDSHTIITAAHCIRRSTYYTYYIRVGTTKKNEGTRYLVSKVQKHDKYTNVQYGNDIGLFTVKSEIKMSSYVQPVCLPEHPASTDKKYFVIGWGRNEKNEYPTMLQEAAVYLLEKSDCRKYYPYESNSTLCANNKEDNQPICFGDSGGPLLGRNTHGNWVAYGVSSYGKSNCAGADSSPGAFADIYNLMTWVEENR